MMTRTRSATSGIVRGLAAAMLGVALTLSTGCVARPTPFAAPVPGITPPDLTFVIPTGTASADMRGEPIFTIPSEMTVLTGQSIVIKNDDHAMHYFAEAPIAPGQTYRKVFGRPGAFGYGGILSCSIAEKKTVTVTVVDRLPDGPAAPTSGTH